MSGRVKVTLISPWMPSRRSREQGKLESWISQIRLGLFCGVLLLVGGIDLSVAQGKDGLPEQGALKMADSSLRLNQEALDLALEKIRLHGDKIPAETQKNILIQRVVEGISPNEARLAGGAFFFKVEADTKVWPPHSDPLVVMNRQSVAPDDSKIWMTFQNETQFPAEGMRRFTVEFARGKAVKITKAQ